MPEDNTAMTPSIPLVDPNAVPTPEAGAAVSDAAAMPSEETSVDAGVPADADVAMPVNAPAPVSVPVGASAAVVEPVLPDAMEPGSARSEVASKIRESKNVLIALSSDPSVDEMAAAIGLSMYLDKIGKRATAIYSGATPNALEFLKPEETFEATVDTLQDFVIAISKDKADHLRYKLDGNYVKIYITPYKTRVSEDDLDFSYGDFNVDLVIALDVANGTDLDSALREHGRIMHDAAIINITTGNPGKFGEIEWSDKKASSVSEMIANLLYDGGGGGKIEKEEATAFLTGIVAATNRFSNAGTTPETMQIAARLMKSGANQQLVSKNITADVENEMLSLGPADVSAEARMGDPDFDVRKAKKGKDSKSIISADKPKGKKEEPATEAAVEPEPVKAVEEVAKEIAKDINEIKENKETNVAAGEEDDALLDDLKAAAESLAHAGAETMPEADQEKVKIDSEHNTSNMDEIEAKEPNASTTAPVGNTIEPPANIAAMNAPEVPANPEINGVPEMNYMPMPGDEILPPPPVPPVDFAGGVPEMSVPTVAASDAGTLPVTPIEPATPAAEPTLPEELRKQSVPQDQIYGPQASDPGAFRIPGM